ncbi:MAG: hypothetical protein RTV72_02695 [Candidatus Thorarchaeota archaeon]
MNSIIRPPKWAYLISGILIAMTSLLGVTIVYVLLEMLPRGMDIQIPLLFIVLPLSILITLTTLTMAVLLTKKRA